MPSWQLRRGGVHAGAAVNLLYGVAAVPAEACGSAGAI